MTDDELKRLNKILRQKNTSETVANRIRILKDRDANHPPVKTYKQCASDHGISEPTITNVVKKFVNEGLDATIKLKRSVNSDNAQRKVDGRVEAKLLEVARGMRRYCNARPARIARTPAPTGGGTGPASPDVSSEIVTTSFIRLTLIG